MEWIDRGNDSWLSYINGVVIDVHIFKRDNWRYSLSINKQICAKSLNFQLDLNRVCISKNLNDAKKEVEVIINKFMKKYVKLMRQHLNGAISVVNDLNKSSVPEKKSVVEMPKLTKAQEEKFMKDMALSTEKKLDPMFMIEL